MESDRGTPMTKSMWGSLVIRRKGRISSTVDHFVRKRYLIAHAWNKHNMKIEINLTSSDNFEAQKYTGVLIGCHYCSCVSPLLNCIHYVVESRWTNIHRAWSRPPVLSLPRLCFLRFSAASAGCSLVTPLDLLLQYVLSSLPEQDSCVTGL